MKQLANLRHEGFADGNNYDDTEEINLSRILSISRTYWRLVIAIICGSISISLLYAITQPRTWKGEFIILLRENASPRSAEPRSSIAALNAISSIAGVQSSDDIETEMQILESPLVLKPVFEYVQKAKGLNKTDSAKLRFSDWVRSVQIFRPKGTSVLKVSYIDTDKSIILPVTNLISEKYQEYSGRAKRRELSNSMKYLNSNIAIVRPKADSAIMSAQGFAIENNIEQIEARSDSIPSFSSATDSLEGGGVKSKLFDANLLSSPEESDVAKLESSIRLLKYKLRYPKLSDNQLISEASVIPELEDLFSKFRTIDFQLGDTRARLRDNDPLVQSLLNQRKSIINIIREQYISLLKGKLAQAQSNLVALKKPKDILLEYRQLIRKASRLDQIAAGLEGQLQISRLDYVREKNSWELISQPIVVDEPVGPNRKLIIACGALAGLLIGVVAALLFNRISGRVFDEEELVQFISIPLLAHVKTSHDEADQAQLNLLSKGPFSDISQLALIPVGISPKSPALLKLITQLKLLMPDAQVLCVQDLVQAARCDQQILVTSLESVTRKQLVSLRQQLTLQGRPVAGWVLINAKHEI